MKKLLFYVIMTISYKGGGIVLYKALAAQSNALIVDIVAILFIFIMVSICAKKGFIDCFFGTVTTMLALVVALTFTKLCVQITGGMFGLEDLLQGKFEGTFAKINGFNADVSQSGVEAAIKEQNVPAIMARLVMKMVGNPDNIPTGTTLAMLLSEEMAALSITLICAVTLFIVIKICMKFLRGILTAIANNIKLVHGVNVLLGATIGFLEGALILCGLLAVLTVFPNEAIINFLSQSTIVSELYINNPLVSLMGAML